ncbi:exonuclease SbcCD subunit D [Sulfurospirillum sp. T05]|uniref:Exonuclease SbcCD subunit D n=1 Tax=Sulfurospirillum tamanense TaxID=2813362 RepID=A0ABS2WV26_9BACT|nr:exonuclease SbcCD subunit D [Sulfurospirillum tamanensis]MBN2965511.1 exonuclease SbcCD subunit D [Sulfurospirillum tamanensis]
MRLLHFSDTHLGFNDLEVLNAQNINQREADFYDAFEQVVAQIEALRPDFILHTGDLFHRSSPSNRAITFALEQFKIIDSLGIPCVMIAGNHSTPRTNLSSPILKIFENFKNIHVAYSQAYEKFAFEEVVFHALPHMNDETKALSQIERCEQNIDPTKRNIMLLHCSVGAHYLMAEFGEWVYPREKEALFAQMDYVALGHWHGFGKVGKHENVYYAGSSERTSLNDKRNSKGFALVELGEALHVEYHEIAIRPIKTYEIDCEDFESAVAALHVKDVKDALVEVKLTNLTALQSIDIQTRDIKNLFEGALHVSIKREFKGTSNDTGLGDIEALSLEAYFLEHIKEESSDAEFARLKDKIQGLFSSYEEVSDESA